MKKQLLLIVFIFISSFVFGQINSQDVVYLKDGSIIRGIIVEEVPNISIKIETMDKNSFVILFDEILKLTREDFPLAFSTLKLDIGNQFGFGSADVEDNRLEFNVVKSFRLNSFLTSGIGSGVRYFYEDESTYIPLYVDLTTELLEKRLSKFFSLNLGYSFLTQNLSKSGAIAKASTGFRFYNAEGSAVSVALGFEVQRVKSPRRSFGFPPTSGEEIRDYGAITMNIGVLF